MAQEQHKSTNYNFQDLTGRREKSWVVVKYVGRLPQDCNIYWLCRCDCGTEKIYSASHIKRQIGQSCGCRKPSFKDSFWGRAKKLESGCWEWQGAKRHFGYGQVYDSRKKKLQAAHRVSYELTYGPIPEGMLVLHRCDNPPCVRPDHLFLGDTRANVDDKVSKRRQGFRITPEKVSEIFQRWKAGEATIAQLARESGVTHGAVRHIVHGYAWCHVTGLPSIRKPRRRGKALDGTAMICPEGQSEGEAPCELVLQPSVSPQPL